MATRLVEMTPARGHLLVPATTKTKIGGKNLLYIIFSLIYLYHIPIIFLSHWFLPPIFVFVVATDRLARRMDGGHRLPTRGENVTITWRKTMK